MVEQRIGTGGPRSLGEFAGSGADPRAESEIVELHRHRRGGGWQRVRLTRDQADKLPIDDPAEP